VSEFAPAEIGPKLSSLYRGYSFERRFQMASIAGSWISTFLLLQNSRRNSAKTAERPSNHLIGKVTTCCF
jgi:hypothetical protein